MANLLYGTAISALLMGAWSRSPEQVSVWRSVWPEEETVFVELEYDNISIVSGPIQTGPSCVSFDKDGNAVVGR